MIDRGEGDGDRFAPFIGDHEGDDLGAGRAEFASEGFVSDADHDLGSFAAHFSVRLSSEKIEKWPKFKIDLVTFVSHTPSGYPGGVHYTVAPTVFLISLNPIL